jgi:hypothetical protein
MGSERMKMITVDEEVLRQALEFIKVTNARSEFWLVPGSNLNKTVNALKAALEQREQEPVASIYVTIGGDREFDDWRVPLPVGRNLLYTNPPRREWRGLTEDEIDALLLTTSGAVIPFYQAMSRAIEAALKEKNA